MRPLKLTLSTVVSGVCILVALIMGGAWIIGHFFYKTDNSIYTTQWIVVGYLAFSSLGIGILIPILRWTFRSLRRKYTHPIDAIMTIVIGVPAILIFICILPPLLYALRAKWLTMYRYVVFHTAISGALFILGVRVRYRGILPPKNRQYALIMNHSSPLDYELGSQAAGTHPWNIVAGSNLRKASFKEAISKRSFRALGDWCIAMSIGKIVEEHSISIDRKSLRSRADTYTRMCEEADLGKNIVIFPEGTRLPFEKIREGKFLGDSFHDGVFRLAFEKGIPVQVLVFDWPAIWRAKDDPRSGFRPCVVEGNFVGMVEPAWFGTMEEMKEYCYKMMYDTLASSDRVRRFIEEIKTA